MPNYAGQTRILAAVDCIIFGFDGESLKVLLMKRSIDPEKNKWSLIGNFMAGSESLEQAAIRVLKKFTGIEGLYMHQLQTFSHPDRDPLERTISTAFTTLIDIHQYEKQIIKDYHAEWFLVGKTPRLIFDHDSMLKMAQQELRYQAASHPILFEMLPEKFTIPQLQNLYEGVYETRFDNRNFSRKVLSTELLIKLREKDKSSSKKGAFYYKLNKKKYKAGFRSFLNFIPNPDRFAF
ncbi:MAG TPA: NUDIX domain-containing protein [Puia sp.]|nr:NUDIX domain-containing protein [Puia sp.]